MTAITYIAVALGTILAPAAPPPPAPALLCVPARTLEYRMTTAPMAAPDDPWFAEDKVRHFAMSFAATTFASAAGRSLGLDDVAPPVAAGLALGAGVAKELVDARSGRPFSVLDLAWDAAGVAVAYVLARNGR